MLKAKEAFSVKGIDIAKGEYYVFHAYTDGQDVFTTNLKEAVNQVRTWFKKGFRALRIEIQIAENEDDFSDDITILSYGAFPA